MTHVLSRANVLKVASVFGSAMAVFTPMLTHAQLTIPSDVTGTTPSGNLQDVILNTIIPWALGIVLLVAVVMLIIGGFLYVTSSGNEGMLERAKHTMLYAIIGIVVVILAFVIVRTIANIFQ